jgi:hypothetical protein
MRGFERGYERGAEAFFGDGLWFVGGLLAILLIAAARHAAGEIDRDQFEQVRTDLLAVTDRETRPPRTDPYPFWCTK